MPTRDIVVIGASTGGIEALQTLVRELPKDFKASVFVVLHVAAQSPNVLHRILERAGPLPASAATDGERIRPAQIYVATADHHLLLEASGQIRISRGPKENRFRPAIDPLFRSAAYAFGPRVVGVVLTGFLDDGTAGLWAIKQRGGVAIVQDPADALAPSMPASALRQVPVDYCLRLNELAPKLGAVGQYAIRGERSKGCVRRAGNRSELPVKITPWSAPLKRLLSSCNEWASNWPSTHTPKPRRLSSRGHAPRKPKGVIRRALLQQNNTPDAPSRAGT